MIKYVMTVLLVSVSVSVAEARTIYVAKNGNDSNSGTLSAPYKTINRAASVATAGDIVNIRAGTYEETLKPANSGSSSNPIVFQAYGSEKVIITAMQALNGWTRDSGNVYRTQVDFDLGQENFVMHNSTALDLARWPNNTDGDPFTTDSLRNSGGSPGSQTFNAKLRYDPGLPNIDWSKGGSVYFYGDKPGSGWLAWKAFIKWSNGTEIGFDLDKSPNWIRTFHAPADKGEFFLEGVRGALDYQNEWFFDNTNNQLYVQLPNGAAPQMKNLAVFGGSINITGNASNNKISGVSSFYGNHTRGVFRSFRSGVQSISLQGENNIIEHSEVAFGSGTGIQDSGKNNKILNSYIHDFNTLGSYDSALGLRGGTNSLVNRNTVSRAGRDTINSINRNSVFSYNDISYSNLIADDCGLFYTVGGPQNVEIHHNWFHDAYSSGNKRKAAGIYLDNDSEGFKVHHNVVWNTEWTNVQINWDGKDIDVFNNTLVDGSATMGAWHKEGTQFTNVRVWNNLSDKSDWEPQSDKQNNVTYQQVPFINKTAGNFNLKSNSEAQDKGRFINGITTDVTDSQPDVGAYEFGGTAWVAGINWNKNAGAANRCYGLPGEKCGGSTQPTPPIGNDSVKFTVRPTQLPAQQSYTFNVNYTVAAEQELVVELWKGGKWLKGTKVRLQAGSRMATATISLDSVPVSGNDYLLKTHTFPIGGTWRDATANDQVSNITISGLPANNSVRFSDRATQLSSKQSYTFNVDYSSRVEQEVVTELWKGGTWLKGTTVRVQPGSGSIAMTVNLDSAPLAGNDYLYKTYAYPVGGTWRDATANDQVTGVTVSSN